MYAANDHCVILAPEKRRSVNTVSIFKTNLDCQFMFAVK